MVSRYWFKWVLLTLYMYYTYTIKYTCTIHTLYNIHVQYIHYTFQKKILLCSLCNNTWWTELWNLGLRRLAPGHMLDFYHYLHLQSIVKPDELFHSILPGVKIKSFILLGLEMDFDLTCACQATISSHSIGSPSDSSPILHTAVTCPQSGPKTAALLLSWRPVSGFGSGPVLRTARCGGGRLWGCKSTCSCVVETPCSSSSSSTLCVQPSRISCWCFPPSAS